MSEPTLSLGAQRDDALARAAEHVARAWREFDRARDRETEPSDDLLTLLRADLPETASDPLLMLDRAAQVLDASLAQSRPRYLAFIGSSGLEIGALADLLAHTYDPNLAVDAKAATRLERQAVRWLGDFLGFPTDAGAFTSGGTVSNITALASAREIAIPGSRRQGLRGKRAMLYCSEEAHYSNQRAAEMLGLGSEQVRRIAVDDRHRMRPDRLREAIAEDIAAGSTPVAVVATAGTTLTGAIDPLDAIADVCAEFGVWMHVDGAYGAPAAVVPGVGSSFRGMERADSLTVDCHKWMFVPKACSAVLVRDGRALVRAFAHDEAYMPHEGEELNAVDTTLEYSRPFRALKLWLAFNVHGAAAFRVAIARNIEQAALVYELASARPTFAVLPNAPELSIVPIRVELPGCVDADAHNAALALAIQADGRVYLSPAIVDGRTWLRPCFTNFRTTEEDVRVLIAVVEELGGDCAALHAAASASGK